MIAGYLVIREQRNIDPKYWVCLDRADALIIAGDVTNYWKKQYDDGELDNECDDEEIYRYIQEDCFSVIVRTIKIRERTENEQLEKI